jgi:hypothetical protein
MATSGSTAFNPEFTELAEMAWAQAGREMRSGFDLRLARYAMNMLTIELANRGINMWTIEQGTIPLEEGVNTYDLPADTIDLLEHVIRTSVGQQNSQADLNITRISVSTYSTIPNKLVQARPIQVWVQRLRDNPKITVWPTPDQGSIASPYYTFVYWRMRRMQDAGAGIETQDLPFRFLPVITSGLAYQLALKTPELMQRVPMLKAEYDQQFDLAAGEDRERAALRLVPRQMFMGGGTL